MKKKEYNIYIEPKRRVCIFESFIYIIFNKSSRSEQVIAKQLNEMSLSALGICQEGVKSYKYPKIYNRNNASTLAVFKST